MMTASARPAAGGDLRRRCRGERDDDRVGEAAARVWGDQERSAGCAPTGAASRRERGDRVRAGARLWQGPDEVGRRARGEHVGQRHREVVHELVIGAAQVDRDRPCGGLVSMPFERSQRAGARAGPVMP